MSPGHLTAAGASVQQTYMVFLAHERRFVGQRYGRYSVPLVSNWF